MKETSTFEANKVEAAASRKFLTFKLNKEAYGIEAVRVREILEMQPTTVIPKAPDYVVGVMNLRSRLVPVLDLKIKLGINRNDDNQKSCIVVVEIMRPTSELIGLIVDSVNEVVEIINNKIEIDESHHIPATIHCIEGIYKQDDVLIYLMDIAKMLEN